MFQSPIEIEEEDAIIVENVSKHFRIPYEKKTTVVEHISGMIGGRTSKYQEFYALKNVSFRVKKGETLGIIGENGSGKSTLLKIIAGVLSPDSGSVKVNGKIAPFLELGVGFQPDLTAEDNVRLYGAVMGMNKEEMEEKFDEIFEFAELENFRLMKMKNFSSGMYARLAFATATSTNPDILLIDEVLAVGDEAFQRKCFKQMEEFKKTKTILFISHDASSITKLCSKIILLNNGELIENNDASLVVDKYHAMLSSRGNKERVNQNQENQTSYKRYGTMKAEIFDIQFNTNNIKGENIGINNIDFGADTYIQFKIKFHEEAINPIVGYIIRDINGNEIYNINTFWNDIVLGKLKKDDTICIIFSQKMFLNNGIYLITVALSYSDTTQFYDWHDNIIKFNVRNDNKSCGVVDLKSKIEISII
ncbi:MAG: ABC transporter ATP-binding protein [Methanosarcinales archaeon]|nr:ABC transporter ATP-binding protein [Methanosarcinales archaeon]